MQHLLLGPIIALLLHLSISSAYPFVIVPMDELHADHSHSHIQKRAFDRIEDNDFGLMKRSIPIKRAFDRLDFTDFSMRRKRAFDRLDFTDFSMRRKRAFDRLEANDFGLYKRSVPMDEDGDTRDINQLGRETRSALIHELAESIRTLRKARQLEMSS